jgi:hypothetical protein
MTQHTYSTKQTLQNLILACLNATLILVFLCLLTAYFAFKKVDGIAKTFAQNVVSITPFVEEVSALNMTLIGLREDIGVLRESPSADGDAASHRLEARLDKIQSDIDVFNERIGNISNAPTKLIDHAIDKTAFVLKNGFYEMRSCSRPTSPEPLSETLSK